VNAISKQVQFTALRRQTLNRVASASVIRCVTERTNERKIEGEGEGGNERHLQVENAVVAWSEMQSGHGGVTLKAVRAVVSDLSPNLPCSCSSASGSWPDP
jgi:hypothetical protein